MYLKHVVEAFAGSAGNVILEQSLFMNESGNYTVGTFVTDYDSGLDKLVDIHDVAKFLVRKLFIVPPVVILSAPIFVNRYCPTNTKDVSTAKYRTAILDPERVPLTGSRIVVVATDESVLTLCHLVIGGAAELSFRHRVAKPYSEVPHLERLVNAFDELFVPVKPTVNIADESYLHYQSQEI